MALERPLEVMPPKRRCPGLCERVAGRGVAGGPERQHLLDPGRRALPDVERQHLLDVVLHLVQAAFNGERLASLEDACARRLADVDVRLPRLDLQRDDLRAERPRRDGIEMPALELQIAGDALVSHASVDRRDHLHPARPVLRRQRPLDSGPVRMGHAHESPAAQRRLTPGGVPEAKLAGHHRPVNVELVTVLKQLNICQPEFICALDPQLEHQPVGKIDEILVEHRQPAKDRRLAVVDPVHVSAGVVHTVGVFPLCGAAAAQVAVAG